MKKKKGGCFSRFLYAFFLLMLVVLFSSVANEKKTEQPTPTATPVVTEAADLKAMPIDQALAAITEKADGIPWKTRAVTIEPDVIIVDAQKNNDLLKEKSLLIGSIHYAIDVTKEAFTINDVQQLYFRFHENGRDDNGQQVDMTTITMQITKEKAAELNLDYFREWAATKQLAYLNAIDGYSMHKDYKAIAK
jgi:hypothetical protein